MAMPPVYTPKGHRGLSMAPATRKPRATPPLCPHRHPPRGLDDGSARTAQRGPVSWSGGRARRRWLLRSVVLAAAIRQCTSQGSLGANDEFGLLGEYFVNQPNTCTGGANGSSAVLDTLLPNFTRTDSAISFGSRLGFKLLKCFWEVNVFNSLQYNCRGSGEITKNFAARWTGFLVVLTGGLYEFEMEADDGARVVIGNGVCPSITCSTFDDVMNAGLRKEGDGLLPTAQRENGDSTYAAQCKLCATGIYGDCFMTRNGCEPSRLWTLEGDGGKPTCNPKDYECIDPTACNIGAKTYKGSKYLVPGKHPIKVEYFQRGGDAKMILKWKGPDNSNVMLPIGGRNFVYPKFDGMKAEIFQMPGDQTGNVWRVNGEQHAPLLDTYFSSLGDVRGGTLLRTKDYRSNEILPVRATFGNPPTFSDEIDAMRHITVVRFTGWMKIVTPGTYTFRLQSDDGSRLFIAGRGWVKEKLIVGNDGIKPRLIKATGSAKLSPGLHPFRVEFLFVPSAKGAIVSAPGIVFDWKGPDTLDQWRPTQTKQSGMLRKSNNKCHLSRWAMAGGASATIDCNGVCFNGKEDFVGDGRCDRGGGSMGIEVKNFQCEAWNFDNKDCVLNIKGALTTKKPQMECYSTCPPGDFKRNDCKRCPRGHWNGWCFEDEDLEPYCAQNKTDPGKCWYQSCCTATLYGVMGWGKDCIAFGTYTNCTHKLALILAHLNTKDLDIFARAHYDIWDPIKNPKPLNPVPRVTGFLTHNKPIRLSNTIPTIFITDMFTGRPTKERVCPIGEVSDREAITCFEGPWTDAVQDISKDCQDGNYRDNFCRNRKTKEGQPFVRCCSFAFLNSRSEQECKFVGLPMGTCQKYLDEYTKAVSTNVYTAVTSALVLWECTKNDCNWVDPLLPAVGCPRALNTQPWQTDLYRTPAPGAPLPVDQFAAGAAKSVPVDPPYAIIGGVLGGVVALVIVAFVTFKALQPAEESPWWSDKAHVVSEDTWMEPDVDNRTGQEYNVVRPRPFAFVHIYEQKHGKTKIRALDMDPMKVAVPRVAVEEATDRENMMADEVRHAHRGVKTDEEIAEEKSGHHLGVLRLEDCQNMEAEWREQQKHPKTKNQKVLHARFNTHKNDRDHSRPIYPELVKLPDPFHKGPRGQQATAEDWESDSSASSLSSYSDDAGPAANRRGRKGRKNKFGSNFSSKNASKNASTNASQNASTNASQNASRMASQAGSTKHSPRSGQRSGQRSGAASSGFSSSGHSHVAFEVESSESSDSSYDGPEIPYGLHVQSSTMTRPAAAAVMLRQSALAGGTDGLHGGIPAVCT